MTLVIRLTIGHPPFKYIFTLILPILIVPALTERQGRFNAAGSVKKWYMMHCFFISLRRKIFLLSASLIVLINGNAQEISPLPKPPKSTKYSAFADESRNELVDAAISASEYFEADVQINSDVGNLIDDVGPVVAVYDEEIYIVWNGDETVKSIFFSKSIDGGQTFSNPVKLNDVNTYPPAFSVFQPDIALDAQGNIYVVWFDYRAWPHDSAFNFPIDLYVDKSTDGGITWSSDVKIPSGTGSIPWHFQPYIDIDQSNGNIYISFNDYDRWGLGDQGDVSLTRSTNGGSSFQSKIRMDSTAPSSNFIQQFSHVAVDHQSGHVYVVYQDNRNGNSDIYLSRSSDGGVSIDMNLMVNTVTTNNQEEPSITVNQKTGAVHVAWKDWRADATPLTAPYYNDIYLATAPPGGLSFESAVRVTDEFMKAEVNFNFPPNISTDSAGHIYIVWHDARAGYSNVYYDQSLDGGNSFSCDLVVNSNRDSLSHSLPRITCDSTGKTYIVWMDRRIPGSNGSRWDIFLGGSALQSCLANLSVTPPVTTNTYQAGIVLKSGALIEAPSAVTFRAGKVIELGPDFEINNGAVFNAEIGPCTQ